jgi:hypothetical protein
MRLLKFIGAVAVVLASFWITLLAMDYWDSRPTVRSGPPTQPARMPPSKLSQVFAVSHTPPNWYATDTKTKTSITGTRIVVESSAPVGQYQWQTQPIPTQVNAEYALSYQIAVTGGRLAIGVEDAAGKWIVTKPIEQPHETIVFKAPTPTVRINVYGASPPPTVATISSVSISGPTGK